MRLGLLRSLLASVVLLPSVGFAQDFGYVDANGLPAPATPSYFQALAPSSALGQGRWSAGLRTSYLSKPLSGSQPSADPSGTTTAVVEHLLLGELLLGVGILDAVDVGVGVPVHLYQDGIALSGIGVGDELSAFAAGDPRVTLGYELPLPIALRAYATGFLPLGDAQNFAGERTVRAELGLASEFRFGRLQLGLDVAGRLREVSTISTVTWGPQLKLGLGGAYFLSEELLVGLETVLAPTLTSQPPSPDPPSGYLFPAEALASVQVRVESWTLGAGLGTGIPLTIPSGQSPTAGLRRGPTSPLLRLALEVRRSF